MLKGNKKYINVFYSSFSFIFFFLHYLSKQNFNVIQFLYLFIPTCFSIFSPLFLYIQQARLCLSVSYFKLFLFFFKPSLLPFFKLSLLSSFKHPLPSSSNPLYPFSSNSLCSLLQTLTFYNYFQLITIIMQLYQSRYITNFSLEELGRYYTLIIALIKIDIVIWYRIPLSICEPELQLW